MELIADAYECNNDRKSTPLSPPIEAKEWFRLLVFLAIFSSRNGAINHFRNERNRSAYLSDRIEFGLWL